MCYKRRVEIPGECPSCRHPNKKYYFNPEKRLGYCFHCGYAGGSTTPPASPEPSRINADYVRASHLALFQDRATLSYLLNDRGLKTESLKHFRLGYEPSSTCYEPAVVIPHLDLDGKVCGIKYRHINPDTDPKYIYVKGSRPFIYNAPVLLSTRFPWVVITEGELDCISLFQVASQLPIVGFPGMQFWKDRWLKWFERFERIYIAFDREDRASEEAEKLAKILKDYRCYRVLPPESIKDWNELLVTVGHGKALTVWKQLMQEAKCIGVPLVKETKEYLQEVKEAFFGASSKATSTGFPALDMVTGGLLPGRVYLLKGNKGLGKTTFALHILINTAQSDHKVLIGSFEMKVGKEMILKVISKLLGRNIEICKEGITEQQVNKMVDLVSRLLPISWINRYDQLRLGELYDTVKLKYNEGFRFVLLDHAQFMMNLGHDAEGIVFTEHTRVGKFIKKLTNDFPNLTVILISEINSQGEAMGGLTLPKVVDIEWNYYGTGLEVEKHRVDSSYKGKKVQIRWDGERCKYTVF